MSDTHPLIAEAVAEVEAILAEDPPLTAPEVKKVLGPLLKEFSVRVRGPGCKRLPPSVADRPPLENALMRHATFKELCRRYGDELIALRDSHSEGDE